MTFLEKELQYHKDMEKANKLKFAGKDKEYEKLKKEIDTKYKGLNTERSRALDQYIFRSMANLVVFFECLAKHLELNDIYDNHVKELFGYSLGPDFNNHKEPDRNHNILGRLLGSIMKWDIKKNPNNFRLDLMNEIYKVLYGYLTYLLLTEYGKIPSHILNDIQRIDFLIKLYSRGYAKSGEEKKDLHREPKRPIQF